MANIIPMSGQGSRFSKEGYTTPKPLIPVSGKPMILQVIRTLPKADKWIFIVREEHVRDYAIDKLLLNELSNAIIVVDPNPHGQATSCALALDHLEKDEPMFVAACDNSFLYDKEKYAKLVDDTSIDSIVWTFTKHPSLSEKPESWGWVRVAPDGETIEDMSVKIPISGDPFNDHAVVATFFFRRSDDFKKALDLMIKEEYKINGEYYLDAMPIFYKKLGKKSSLFDVNLYVGWGKPADLHLYEEWEYKVRMEGGEGEEYSKWKAFIDSIQ